MNQKTWIIVANASCARVFRCDSITSLVEIESFVHPESRLHGRDLASDRSGSTTESSRTGYSSLSQPQSPKENAIEAFAKQVADFLEKARTTGEVEKIHLASGPSFLGLLRHTMSNPLTSIIDKTVDKDITHLKPEEIKDYFFI